jgi:hypothetical protein
MPNGKGLMAELLFWWAKLCNINDTASKSWLNMTNAELGSLLNADLSSKDSTALAPGRLKSAYISQRRTENPAPGGQSIKKCQDPDKALEKNQKRRNRGHLQRDSKGPVVPPAAHFALCSNEQLQGKGNPSEGEPPELLEPRPVMTQHTPIEPPANARPDVVVLRWLPTTSTPSAESLASAFDLGATCLVWAAFGHGPKKPYAAHLGAAARRQGRGHPLL